MHYYAVIFLLATSFFSTMEARSQYAQPFSCSGKSCNQDCSSGQCDQTGGNTEFRTCSYCINHCSNRCGNYADCFNVCLRSCNCNTNRVTSCESGDCTDTIVTEPTPPSPCCEVYHPKRCYTEETGNKRCYVRRHKECSNLCSSSVVSLEETERAPSSCHYIKNYPYVYCGNYERQNCGQCNSGSCDDSYNPGSCSRTSGCTQGCRNVPKRITGGPFLYSPEPYTQ